MKRKSKPTRTKSRPTPQVSYNSKSSRQLANLRAWFCGDKAAAYFGRSFEIRSAVLQYLQTGDGTHRELAERFGVTRQHISMEVNRAREVYEWQGTLAG